MTYEDELIKTDRNKTRRFIKNELKKNPELWKVLTSLLGNARKNTTPDEFMDLGVAVTYFGQYWIDEAKVRNAAGEKARRRSQYKRDVAKAIKDSPDLTDGFKKKHLDAEMNLL